jgi:hypothetical protein
MTLSERIAANECAVVECQRHRVTDSLFCHEHLGEMWANRLDRQPDGSFLPRRRFPARALDRSAA